MEVTYQNKHKIRASVAIRSVLPCLSYGFYLSCFVVFLVHFIPIVDNYIIIYSIIGLSSVLISILVVAICKATAPISDVDSLIYLDRKYADSRDQFSTLKYLQDSGPSVYAELVRRSIHPKKNFSERQSRQRTPWFRVGFPSAALCVLLWVPPFVGAEKQSDPVVLNPSDLAILLQAENSLRDLANESGEGSGLPEIAEAMDDLGHELRNGDISREEALSRLADIQDRVEMEIESRELDEAISELSRIPAMERFLSEVGQEGARSEMASSLSGSEESGGSEDDGAEGLDGILEALAESGRSSDALRDVSRAAWDALDSASAGDRNATESSLRNLDEALSESMGSDMPSLREAMGSAGENDDGGLQGIRGGPSSEEIARAIREIEEASRALGESGSDSERMASTSGENDTNGTGSCSSCGGIGLSENGSRCNSCGGSGSTPDGMQQSAQNANGSNSGSGGSGSTNMENPGGPGGDSGMTGPRPLDEWVRIYAERRTEQAEHHDSRVVGEHGNGPAIGDLEFFGDPRSDGVFVPMRESIPQYRRAAESAVESQDIPDRYREYIQDYFK